ncbi:MAG: hypothetical protein CSA35_02325 [Dethiosulfovibrio peptidovorans]|nr:MAG: hypothetical protein CSA35_02325 [Dethiosulfovibrio peptidovorans]
MNNDLSLRFVDIPYFLKTYHGDSFVAPNIILGGAQQLLFWEKIAIAQGGSLCLVEIRKKSYPLGLAVFMCKKIFSINRVSLLDSPCVPKETLGLSYDSILSFLVGNLPWKNVYLLHGVPNYLDPRARLSCDMGSPGKCWETVCIHLLDKSIDDVISEMPKNGRRDVRRSLRENGYECFCVDPEDSLGVKEYVDFFRKEKGYDAYSGLDWQKILSEGRKHNAMYVFGIKSKNELIASSTIFCSESLAKEAAIIKKSSRHDPYAGYRLKIYMLEWLIQRKIALFDLAGVNPFPEMEKDKNIRGFKMKFGGELIRYRILNTFTGLGRVAKFVADWRKKVRG